MQVGAAVDVAPAGDDAVGRRLDPVHRPLGEVRAAVDPELDEGALVDQQVDPLARGQLAALVLFGDLLLAAAEPRLLARARAAARSARPAAPCPAACGRSRSSLPPRYLLTSMGLLAHDARLPGRARAGCGAAAANRRRRRPVVPVRDLLRTQRRAQGRSPRTLDDRARSAYGDRARGSRVGERHGRSFRVGVEDRSHWRLRRALRRAALRAARLPPTRARAAAPTASTTRSTTAGTTSTFDDQLDHARQLVGVGRSSARSD